MIPHCRTQAEFNEACKIIRAGNDVMCHQTFDGAIAETGVRLNGLSTGTLAAAKPLLVLAGDVHRPQHQGIVHYVGAPYHVRFGDDFEPRVLLTERPSPASLMMVNLHFPAPRKWTIKTNKAHRLPEGLESGDHVKVTLTLDREDAVNWHHHRRALLGLCRDKGLEVFGIDLQIKGAEAKQASERNELQTPEQVFIDFCNHEGVADGLRTAGLRLLNDNNHNRQAKTVE